ncbi:hypothetical protein TWF506_003220, partial [Arthrobotrys conoides]
MSTRPKPGRQETTREPMIPPEIWHEIFENGLKCIRNLRFVFNSASEETSVEEGRGSVCHEATRYQDVFQGIEPGQLKGI